MIDDTYIHDINKLEMHLKKGEIKLKKFEIHTANMKIVFL